MWEPNELAYEQSGIQILGRRIDNKYIKCEICWAKNKSMSVKVYQKSRLVAF